MSSTLIALTPTTECKAMYPKLAPANDLIPTRPPITTTTRISPEERRTLSLFPKNPARYIVTERSKITTEMLDTKKPTILPKMHVLMTSKTLLDKSRKADLKIKSTRSPLLKLKLTTNGPNTEKATTINPTQKYIEEITEEAHKDELYDLYDSEELYSSENEQFEENSNESDGSESLESYESDLLAMATHLKRKSIAVTNRIEIEPSGTSKTIEITNETSERSPSEIVKDKLNSSESTSRNESNLSTVKSIKDDQKHKLKR